MSSHASLDAAAQERKARLAKLKNLKRKAPSPDPDTEADASNSATETAGITNSTSELALSEAQPSNPHLSGRNYDPTTRSAKLGFEHNPAASAETAERRAQELAAQAKAEAEQEAKEEEAGKQLDLFKLQPKKPNWDLKRDVEKRMERLNVQTDNAIARLVRERVGAQKKSQEQVPGKEGEQVGGGEALVGDVKGEELVSALHERERQEEEEERKEREEDEAEEDGFK